MKHQVEPENPSRVFSIISAIHGPSRYNDGKNIAINGAVSCVEPANIYPEGVWAWFVGSDRAFLFGFEKNKSWARRRMFNVMRNEHQQIN